VSAFNRSGTAPGARQGPERRIRGRGSKRAATDGAGVPAGARAANLVALGGSAGGLDAIRSILAELPAGLNAAVVVVQHRARASDALAQVLQTWSAWPVSEAEDKDPVEAGRVYVAPADYHLLAEPGHFALSTDDPVLYSRPSIDVLFESVADAYGPAAMGVVLTGANRDGARGLRRIVDRGGLAVVQDPDTAEAPTMPRAAVDEVPEARVLPLHEIPAAIAVWAEGRQAACAGGSP
jgi:two-component system chemotaxis response regulator CheB